MKNNTYNWLWKWHFIAGIIVIPFVLLFSVTGAIYLFKDDYEKEELKSYETFEETGDFLTYENQYAIAKAKWKKQPEAIIIPSKEGASTRFISGRFSHKSSFYLNPTNGGALGEVNNSETDMHKVRKLHGELLLGSFGTKIVELVASWMVVLLVSGVYLFWPRERGVKGLFTIRLKASKRVFFRDLHGVIGFWFSGLLIVILMGGFPWTDVFGAGYKWVQNETKSGYPTTWNGRGFQSDVIDNPSISIDVMMEKAKALNLDGEVSLKLPKSKKGVYTVSNETTHLTQMKSIHFDRYSGEIISENSWGDIGLMMKSRLWLMAFHQGKFGAWNFALILGTAIALIILCLAGILSYLKRKPKGRLAVPKSEGLGKTTPIMLTIVLAVLLPLFGISVILIFLLGKIKILR